MSEGEGKIKINFVKYDELIKLKGIGPRVAKQICRARMGTCNQLRKERWEFYHIWDKKDLTRHFDFTPNPDATQIEDPDFDYKICEEKENSTKKQRVDGGDSMSDTDSEKGAKSKTFTKLSNAAYQISENREIKKPNISWVSKTLSFDGTGHFPSFVTKFRSYIDYEEYDDQTAMYCLDMFLTGSASIFFQHLRAHDQVHTVTDAIRCLKRRFGDNQSEQHAMLQFRNAKQKHNETEEEFEERLSTLAYEVYPNGRYSQIDKEVSMSFISGLNDPKARTYLAEYCAEPGMQEVRKALKNYKFSRQIGRADRGYVKDESAIRQVAGDTDSSSDEDKKHSFSNGREDRNAGRPLEKDTRIDKLEEKMERIEEKMERMNMKQQECKEMMQSILNKVNRDSYTAEEICYKCQRKGHTRSNCPN